MLRSCTVPLALLVAFSPGSVASTLVAPDDGDAFSPVCTYGCQNCSNPWYAVDASGQCMNRTTAQPEFFAVAFKCRFDDMVIRDEDSCMDIIAVEHANSNRSTLHEQFITGEVFTSWNKSRGCRINAKGSSLFGLDRFQTEICFGLFQWEVALVWLGGALVLGVALGCISAWLSRKDTHHFTDHLVDKVGNEAVFRPGAKMVAMHNVVPSHRRYVVLFYRFNQVIANAWLPMSLMWIVSPLIVLPWWVVLYWVPPLFVVGAKLFSQPRHVMTPAHCSLLGLAVDQRSSTKEYLFSMLRPFILLGGVFLSGYLVVFIGSRAGHSDIDIGVWIMNPVGFWRGGLEDIWGNIVIYFSAVVTVIGCFLHLAMTFPPVANSLCGTGGKPRTIRLDTDQSLHKELEELTHRVCEAATADDEDDQDRVAALDVETLSKFNVIVAISLAFIDFAAYVYKVYVFLKDGRYQLAAAMTLAVVESLVTLVLNGHFRRAPHAIKTVIVSGVPTVDYLALTQWDDGLAGIPCLWLTIYGLPLTRIKKWSTCLASIFFLLSGTRALASFMSDVTDADMYGVPEAWSLLGDEDEEDGESGSEEE